MAEHDRVNVQAAMVDQVVLAESLGQVGATEGNVAARLCPEFPYVIGS